MSFKDIIEKIVYGNYVIYFVIILISWMIVIAINIVKETWSILVETFEEVVEVLDYEDFKNYRTTIYNEKVKDE